MVLIAAAPNWNVATTGVRRAGTRVNPRRVLRIQLVQSQQLTCNVSGPTGRVPHLRMGGDVSEGVVQLAKDVAEGVGIWHRDCFVVRFEPSGDRCFNACIPGRLTDPDKPMIAQWSLPGTTQPGTDPG